MKSSLNSPSINGFSLKSVSQQTELSAHVLRVWERRYGAVTPQRDKANRRIYSETELKRLLNLSKLVKHGQSIGNIAHLSEDELNVQLGLLDHRPQTIWSEKNIHPDLDKELLNRLYESVLCYDMDTLYQEMTKAIESFEVDDFMIKICSQIMRRIGDDWAAGRINIVQEHMVSAAMKSALMPQIRSSMSLDDAPSIVFTTLQNERHEMGLIFAACMAAARNIRCFYFGPDLPLDVVAQAISHIEAKILAISLVNPISETATLKELEQILSYIPLDCEIWIGGIATEYIQHARLPERCTIMDHQTYSHALDDLVTKFKSQCA